MEFESAATRRLPVYLLLDCSGSMAGAPIESVNQGMTLMVNDLRNNPQALETVWISVITFGGEARQALSLTELANFIPPILAASGSTPLGAALRILNDALDREIIANSPERKGDFKPLMFLFTDGEPTDEWESYARAIKSRGHKKLANIIALGCSDNVNTETLKAITDTVLLMRDATPDAIGQFFRWVSQSVKTASVSAAGAGSGEGAATLPPPPAVIQVAL